MYATHSPRRIGILTRKPAAAAKASKKPAAKSKAPAKKTLEKKAAAKKAPAKSAKKPKADAAASVVKRDTAPKVAPKPPEILERIVKSLDDDKAEDIVTIDLQGRSSLTDAIVIALKALDVGEGDAVFTVSLTAVATVAAVELAGATPVLGAGALPCES